MNLVTVTVEGAPELAALRSVLRDALQQAGVGGAERADVLLLATELAANALHHGSTDRTRVMVDLADDQVHVFVRDRSVAAPVVRAPDSSRVGGNGMRIVDAIAAAWGTYHHDGLGKTVWCRSAGGVATR